MGSVLQALHTPTPQRLAVTALFNCFLLICTCIPFFASSRLPWGAQLCRGCPGAEEPGLLPAMPPREVPPALPAGDALRDAPGARQHPEKGIQSDLGA